MKKFVALCMTAVMAMALFSGCGSQTGNSENKVSAKVIEIDLTDEQYAFGVDKNQPELLEQVNEFIEKIQKDGSLDEIFAKYFGGGEPAAIKSAELDPSKDQLVVATNAAFEPFEYTKGGQDFYGVDMEIAALLAEELGQELVIQNMDFDAVCLSVGQQKCDIAMAGLTINDKRKEQVDFSTPYYEASQRLIVRSDDSTFDSCKDAAAVETLLKNLDDKTSIGVQGGTTGQFYVEGDEDWGFEGLSAKCVPYKSGTLAVQDLLNGNIQYVMIDAAPAKYITDSINAMR